MRLVASMYSGLLTLCGLLAGLATAVMAALITLNVVFRNLGVTNFPWLLEVSEYVLFVGTFLAAPWVLRLGAHVRVDLLVSVVPRRAARVLNLAADALGLVFCALLGRHGWNVAADSFTRGDMLYKELVIPEWPLLAVIPFSAALLGIEFLRRMLRPEGHPGHGVEASAAADGL